MAKVGLRWPEDADPAKLTPLERRIDEAAAAVRRSCVAAQQRLERAQSERALKATALAVLGGAGMVELVMLFLNAPPNQGLRYVELALSSLLILGSLTLLAGMARWEDTRANAALDALTDDRHVLRHAKALRPLPRVLGDTPSRALELLVGGLEDAAAGSKAREIRIRAETYGAMRRHERITPKETRVVVTTARGQSLRGTILDVSMSGVGIQGNFPGVTKDMVVTVGSRKARVARILSNGIACAFLVEIRDELLDEHIVL